jgi:hypothetical protein
MLTEPIFFAWITPALVTAAILLLLEDSDTKLFAGLLETTEMAPLDRSGTLDVSVRRVMAVALLSPA